MSNVPFPLEGSYISNVFGIYIIAKRKQDVLMLLHKAIDMACFDFSGCYADVFRFYEDDDIFYCNTIQYTRLIINEHRSERFCQLYGFEYREDFSE